MKTFHKIILIGLGATLFIDFWKLLLVCFDIKTRGVLFLGRWLGYAFDEQFLHNTIIQAPSLEYEKSLGVLTHYCIGILFAFLLSIFYGSKWLSNPKTLPAITVGLISLLPPIFIIQPLFGFGIAFSKIPDSSQHHLKILIIHLIYGIGLYLTAIVLRRIKLFNQ